MRRNIHVDKGREWLKYLWQKVKQHIKKLAEFWLMDIIISKTILQWRSDLGEVEGDKIFHNKNVRIFVG